MLLPLSLLVYVGPISEELWIAGNAEHARSERLW